MEESLKTKALAKMLEEMNRKKEKYEGNRQAECVAV